MDVQALSSSTGVNGSEQRGSLCGHGHSRVRRGSSVHQHGVVRVVVSVVDVGMVGEERVERWSVTELGGVGSHLVRVGESGWGHAHAHRTALRYVLPWHAWQTSPFFSAFCVTRWRLHVVPLPIHAHIHPHSTHRPSWSDPHVLLTIQYKAAHWLALWTVRCSLAHCSI